MAGYISKKIKDGILVFSAAAALSGCSVAFHSKNIDFKAEVPPIVTGGYVSEYGIVAPAPIIVPQGQYIPPIANFDTPWNYGWGGYRGYRGSIVGPHNRRW